MSPSALAYALNGYANDLDKAGMQYATMAAVLREAAAFIEGQCLTEDELIQRIRVCLDCDD